MNIDDRIDYATFYMQRLGKAKRDGKQIIGCCPIHNERNPSFSANTDTGMWKCFGCGEQGNIYTFIELSERVTADRAREVVRGLAGMDTTQHEPAKPARARYSIEDYAGTKRLDIGKLRLYGIKENNAGTISIPYQDEHGKIRCTRTRGTQGMRWAKGAAGNIIPYGVWKPRIADDAICIVEGESDCHTLWQHGIENVIGCPGAQMWNQAWNHYAHAQRVYIHREPPSAPNAAGQVIDAGGQFVQRIAASLYEDKDFQGTVYEISLQDTCGHKDPSDAHLADPAHLADVWSEAITRAREIPRASVTDDTLHGIAQDLKIPDQYMITKQGVQRLGVKNNTPHVFAVCPIPVVPIARMRSIDTGNEKLQVAFKRGKWREVAAKRSTVSSSSKIIELADQGLIVTSSTAKEMVDYLAAVESANLANLPEKQSVERMGWVSKSVHMPFAPGDVILDTPDGMQGLVAGYRKHGKPGDWEAAAKTIRQHHPIARSILAAGFAAPMLRVLGVRSFALYVWSRSRGGKTAAEKLALAAWGDPESLMVTFNATQVGIERLAGFYNDLPLGIDERQVAGSQESLDRLAYMIGAGKGRLRGNREGGMQATSSWRTVAIMTGEQELTDTTTHEGALTRTLQIAGAPLEDERFARDLHRIVENSYGHAGPAYIAHLVKARASGDADLRSEYEAICSDLERACPDNAVAHVGSVGALAMADWMAGKWLFGEDDRDGALAMGMNLLGLVGSVDEMSMAGKISEWCRSWLMLNVSRFDDSNTYDSKWGEIDKNGNVWVLPKVLEDACRTVGWRRNQVRDALVTEGAIRNGVTGEATIAHRFGNRVCRMICFESWGNWSFYKDSDDIEWEEPLHRYNSVTNSGGEIPANEVLPF